MSAPEGFRHVYGPNWRHGSLEFFSRESPAAFWVRARGVIVPRLIRTDLEVAAAFGRGHPEGFDYVADVREVWMIDPRNLWLLRRVRELPNLKSWSVIVGGWTGTMAMRALPRWARPDVVATEPSDLEL